MKEGDKVVCINEIPGFTIKNKIYTISCIYSCVCGESFLGWGVSSGKKNHFECHTCDHKTNTSITDWICTVKYFRKVEPNKFKNKLTQELAIKQLTTQVEEKAEPLRKIELV